MKTKRERERNMNGDMKEVFYLTTHSTHFIYGYMGQTYGKEPFR